MTDKAVTPKPKVEGKGPKGLAKLIKKNPVGVGLAAAAAVVVVVALKKKGSLTGSASTATDPTAGAISGGPVDMTPYQNSLDNALAGLDTRFANIPVGPAGPKGETGETGETGAVGPSGVTKHLPTPKVKNPIKKPKPVPTTKKPKTGRTVKIAKPAIKPKPVAKKPTSPFKPHAPEQRKANQREGKGSTPASRRPSPAINTRQGVLNKLKAQGLK